MNAELSYLNALDVVYHEGQMVETSHGIRTRSFQGIVIRADVRAGWPLLTTKAMNWKHQVAEVCWYLSGDDHIRNLRKYARYWDAWADDQGNLQTAYGRFWRRFPTPSLQQMNAYDGDRHVDWEKATARVSAYPNDEIWPLDGHPLLSYTQHQAWTLDTNDSWDQIRSVINMMRKDPYTRRAVVSAWHPGNAHLSMLPPCHFAWRLSYDGKTLNITVYQRSADMPLGVPYNLAQYSLLLMLLSKDIGLPAGKVVFFLDDAHIYENQLEGVREQLNRDVKPLPGIIVPNRVSALKFGWEDINDFGIINYDPHPAIKYPITEVGVTNNKEKDNGVRT